MYSMSFCKGLNLCQDMMTTSYFFFQFVSDSEVQWKYPEHLFAPKLIAKKGKKILKSNL